MNTSAMRFEDSKRTGRQICETHLPPRKMAKEDAEIKHKDGPDYDFFLSVLDEVLPSEMEEEIEQLETPKGDDESEISEEAPEDKIPKKQHPNRVYRTSLGHSPHGRPSVPFEVLLIGQENSESSSSEHLSRDNSTMVTADHEIPEEPIPGFLHTVDALSQLSVSESVGSLPRSMGLRRSDRSLSFSNRPGSCSWGSPPPERFANSRRGSMNDLRQHRSNEELPAGMLSPNPYANYNRDRRQRSLSLSQEPASLLVRELRSFPSSRKLDQDDSVSTNTDLAPRMPMHGLSIHRDEHGGDQSKETPGVCGSPPQTTATARDAPPIRRWQ